MRIVNIIWILLVLSSNHAYINGECDVLISNNCENVTNQAIITSIRKTKNICFLCDGLECVDPIKSVSAEAECDTACYIGINEFGLPQRGCANALNSTKDCSKDENSISQCFICDSDYCNAILYPINGRLQCHTCLNNLCQPHEDDIQYCSRYHKDEKCVTIYAPDVDAVESRGCLSDVDLLGECKNSKSNCLMCSTDKCNNDGSKSEMYSCVGCNSIDDRDCIRNDYNFTKRCSSDECYSRVTISKDEQMLERGCLADIFVCSGSSCESCTGTNCNKGIFPENRISCKYCDGESCMKEPLKDKICNNYVNNDACITFYGSNDKVIYKDCYDDVPSETQNICNNSDNLKCTKCSGSLCNTDIKRRGSKCFQCAGIDCFHPTISDIVDCLSDCFVGVDQNGETVRGCANKVDSSTLCGNDTSNCIKCSDDLCNGIVYPVTSRLSCLSCNIDENCLNIDSSKYCEVFGSHETCVTVFDSFNQVAERGCLSTISSGLYCKANQSSCLQCHFDNCNVQTSIEQLNHCVSCSSKNDNICVTNPKASLTVGCKGKCFTRFVPNDNENIERGCSDSIASTCTSGNCIQCEGDRCNSLVFPDNRLSCYKCVGSDCDISDAQMNKEYCLKYKGSANSCLTVFDEASRVILKGCYSDVSTETRVMCDDSNDILCTKCSGNNCNTIRQRRGTKCIRCVGLDCLYSDYPANTVNCQSGGCYVGVDANGLTRKGCATSFEDYSTCAVGVDTEVTKSCLTCDKDFCNAIVYPLENRLMCLNCYGDNCGEASIDDKYCEQLHPNEQCVSIFSSDNKIIERGCLSTIQNTAVCTQNSSNCLKCNANRCNSQNSRDEKFSCVSCDSIADPLCTSVNSRPNIKPCTTNQCYSRLIPVSTSSVWKYIEKGCVSDLQIGGNATICTGSMCNNIVYPNNLISCNYCSGNECMLLNVSTKYCGLYNQQMQSCITVFGDRQGVIYRGCYSDVATGTQETCDDFTQLACTKCSLGPNCNTDKTRRGFKCYKCSGTECFTASHPADVIDCLSSCYIGLNGNGENVRGCYATISNNTCGLDEDGQHECIACQNDFCNGITYPITKRLSCHICQNSYDCLTPSDDNINYCPIYGEQEKCVTVFSADNKVIERGCSSTLNNDIYCSQNYKNCKECATNGCNNITSVDTKMCAYCNSIVDPNCVINPNMVPTKNCNKGCYTRLINGNLYRGCAEDLNDDVCSRANNCVACTDSDKCNVISYPARRKECLTCDSPANCIHPTIKSCIKYTENDTCVTIFNGYRVSRKGCLADQTTNDQVLCAINNKTCLTCRANNCNINNVHPDEKCIICKSDINSNCAQKPQELSSELCSMPSDGECFAKILDGITYRGCKGSLSSSDIDICRNTSVSSECIISSGKGSNNKLIPLMRLKCFHCDSNKDENCTRKQTDFSITLPCKTFNYPENCVKISYSDGRVVRGCLADFSSDICSNGKCETCPSNSITDGCNFNIAGKLFSSDILFVITILSILLLK